MKKKLLPILSILMVSMLFMACPGTTPDTDADTDTNTDNATTDITYTAKAAWGTAQADGATIIDESETVLATAGYYNPTEAGADMTGTAGSATALFGTTANALNFVTDGTGWGGSFFNGFGPLDISTYTNVKVAIKDLDSAVKYIELKLEDGSNNAIVNILDYTGAASGDWTVYTIALSDFTGVDFSGFSAIGIWNLKSIVDAAATDAYLAADFTIDVAFK